MACAALTLPLTRVRSTSKLKRLLRNAAERMVKPPESASVPWRVYSATKGMAMPPKRSPVLASTRSALKVKGPLPLIRWK